MMLKYLKAPFRPARATDAEDLAELINMAGEGIPAYLWQQSRPPDQTILEFGASRAAREEGNFSYRNAIVAEKDGKVAVMLLAYPLAAEAVDLAAVPSVVRPLVELETLVPGSLYINAIAVFPVYRGQGWGEKLLQLADRWAQQCECPDLTLIVSEDNPAQRLYERNGYKVIATRSIVPFNGFGKSGDWRLMKKSRI